MSSIIKKKIVSECTTQNSSNDMQNESNKANKGSIVRDSTIFNNISKSVKTKNKKKVTWDKNIISLVEVESLKTYNFENSQKDPMINVYSKNHKVKCSFCSAF